MLTSLVMRNFKRFEHVEIELGSPVVFIGPNNSGKTSALQALALWQIGLNAWNERRKGRGTPEKRPGVTINRRDLLAMPVPNSNLLWRNLHVRDVHKLGKTQKTANVLFDIVLEGITKDRKWECGFEFDYANSESFYCRPMRLSEKKDAKRMPVPEEAANAQMAFLPPMSGLASNEPRLDRGALNVRIGEGKTAEVLRNLCYMVHQKDETLWKRLVDQVNALFGSELDEPQYVGERGEINMTYRERGIQLDLSSSGRGLQQTLLLLAYMYANPGSILLLDEPDAHLEILRQRHIYQLITDVARENGNQVVAASHSEVLLNEAAGRDVVIAFVGKPHRINDQGSQVQKALRDIGFEHYYLAELTGWVLYLEGSTDLAILRALAEKLKKNEAIKALERPFVHYVFDQPTEVRKHFHGLREAVPGLLGIAVFDRLPSPLPSDLGAQGIMWSKYELENYLCFPETLMSYARASGSAESLGPLFSPAEMLRRAKAMEESIREVETALKTLQKGSPWDGSLKVSDEFLTPLFKKYFAKLGLPNVMAKKNFHELAVHVPAEKVAPEIGAALDALARTRDAATPAPPP
ncbi:MAG: ATP-dependent nuclease [Thermoanaerobaculia bacterium]